jgi:CSLREA domain-containing protein
MKTRIVRRNKQHFTALRALGFIALALAIWLLAPAGIALADDIIVNTTDDELNTDGDCSLREAIQAANTNAAVDACASGNLSDTITIPAGIYTMTLAGGDDDNLTGDYDITETLTLNGAGADQTIIDANQVDRIFHIHTNVIVANLNDLTITNGKASGSGGGVMLEQYPALNVTNCIISNNSASPYGGGMYLNHNNDVVLTNTLVISNVSNNNGGGIMHEGYGGSARIVNSTIAGNHTNAQGGGLYFYRGAPSYYLTIINSTVSGNTANSNAGGIRSADGHIINSVIVNNVSDADRSGDGLGGGLTTGNAIITNTIIANNIDNTGSVPDCSAPVNNPLISGGYNLIEDPTACVRVSKPSDIFGQDPQLGPLQDNGGPTWTHAPLPGSSVIGSIPAGVNGCGTTVIEDQRGVARPVGYTCEIGAVEYNDTAFVEARDDVHSRYKDDVVSVAAPGVLLNDASHNPTASLLSGPSNGTLSLNADGSFIYTPTTSFEGADSFVYIATDGALTDTATVTLPQHPCWATLDDGATEFGSADASAVQEAVNVANSGDTIKIAGDCRGVSLQGGYEQSVYITQSVTLAGGYSRADWSVAYPLTQPTTLDAAHGGRVIYIRDDGYDVTLHNLTITGGRAASAGGAIRAQGVLTVSHCVFHDNIAHQWQWGSGGAIHKDSSGRLYVEDSAFFDNLASQPGSALRINSPGIIVNSVFTNNTISGVHYPGTIYHGNLLQVSDSLIRHNSGTGFVAREGSATLVVTDSVIADNTQGGFMILSSATLLI